MGSGEEAALPAPLYPPLSAEAILELEMHKNASAAAARLAGLRKGCFAERG